LGRFTAADRKRIAGAWSDPSVLQDPVELHALAYNWNWDGGLETLFAIVRHPLCDRGTALLVYWYTSPVWVYRTYADESEVAGPYERQQYRLIKEIESRYTEGFYQNQGIRFDPNTDWPEPYRGEALKQPIPTLLLEASPGKKVGGNRLRLNSGW
jgi:hypothetical protein